MRLLHHVAWTAVLLGLFIAAGDALAGYVCQCSDGTLKYRPLGMPRLGGRPPSCPPGMCDAGTSPFDQNPSPFGQSIYGSTPPAIHFDAGAVIDAMRQGEADRRTREQHEMSMEIQRQQLLILKQQQELFMQQQQNGSPMQLLPPQ